MITAHRFTEEEQDEAVCLLWDVVRSPVTEPDLAEKVKGFLRDSAARMAREESNEPRSDPQ